MFVRENSLKSQLLIASVPAGRHNSGVAVAAGPRCPHRFCLLSCDLGHVCVAGKRGLARGQTSSLVNSIMLRHFLVECQRQKSVHYGTVTQQRSCLSCCFVNRNKRLSVQQMDMTAVKQLLKHLCRIQYHADHVTTTGMAGM